MCFRPHLLACSELTLQIAMDEARAEKHSDRSAAEIQRYQAAYSQASFLAAVHQQHDGREISAGDDNDIRHLKANLGNRWKTQPKVPQSSCLSCSSNHLWSTCKFKTATCSHCGKTSHLAYVCHDTLSSTEMAGL